MASKKKRWHVLGVVLLIIFVGTIQTYGKSEDATEEITPIAEPTISSIEFKTNRFTKPDAETPEITSEPIGNQYNKVAENESLELYLNEKNLALKVKDKRSDYVWSSMPSEQDLVDESLNSEWQANVESPVIVQYLSSSAQVRSGSLSSLEGKIIQIDEQPDGFHAKLTFKALDAEFDLVVKLDGESLVVTIPDESIVESGTLKLYTIQAYSFFGTVRNKNIPGYMFIPDGSGALLRFSDDNPHFDDPFTSFIYGSDPSIYSMSDRVLVPPQPISLPVFGMVHGEGRNGFIAVVEDGKYDAEIIAYPSGINTGFNWITSRFTVRHRYFQPTSKNLGGINTYQRQRLHSNKQVRYMFLAEKEANYIGMAKKYREYLMNDNQLTEKPQAKADIPVRMDVLGAEMEPGLFRKKVVNMTTFEQVQTMIEALEQKGVSNINTVFQGWNKGGLSGRNPDKFPVEGTIGGKDGLKELQSYLDQKDLPLYLAADYTNGFAAAKRFNPRVDAVRRITNQVFNWRLGNFFTNSKLRDIDVYYMNPGYAQGLAQKDVKEYATLGVKHLAINDLGSKLFSDHNEKNKFTREDTAAEYRKIAELFQKEIGNLALSTPNDYLLPYTEQFFNMPMGSSQFMYTTDTVPFLHILLHGLVDYYVAPINFEANPQEQLLRMIEYGAYPSFYLTHERTWELKNTASTHIYTSYYKDWLEFIETNYQTVNEALRGVQNATMEDRKVLDWGVVQVQYSNGTDIYVNYTENDYSHENFIIPAQDFLVKEGDR
ncbi:DUF5696 domain-containing protein [Pseudogracilibacillus auburnensis]|uniref:DUF5696 domain-containing protein n=1 Tax=Pseudogracilibacillus auburnensis TaxID=1494959 RepID=UPI001A95AD3D|nr:DUF5696 domain-containing protein [Pseudogracilibacillus auburnensis]MBO1004831.1 hypothetical protein [Pseudogracilibacillus auburnensis]